jgi:hypothetical protein
MSMVEGEDIVVGGRWSVVSENYELGITNYELESVVGGLLIGVDC